MELSALFPRDRVTILGVMNATPDSFSDGGRLWREGRTDVAAAVDAAAALLRDGAHALDVGGESTRPGASEIGADEEIARTAPLIEALAKRFEVPLSIDTRKAAVMEAALAKGAHLVNDVSALCWDDRSIEVLAGQSCPVVLMHHQGSPGTMQDRPIYGDALIEVYDWLEARIAAAEAGGIARGRIIVDPGIGFGKSVRHNLALLNGLSLFHGLGCPLLLGASRKRLIGALSNEAPVGERLGGSLALALLGAAQGVQLLRVHDVAETVQALKMWRGMRDEALSPV